MSSHSDFASRPRGEKGTEQSYTDINTASTFNRSGDSSGVRARNQNSHARRTYGNAVGDLGAQDDGSTETADSYNHSHHISRRKIRERVREKQKIPGHVQWIKWMHSEWKNHTVAMIGEFIGTTFFLFFAFGGTQVANIGSGTTANNSTTGSTTGGVDPSKLLYISLSFGFSLAVNAWIFFRISGGLFNPAVTLALTLTRDLAPLRAVLLFITQISGACFAAYLVSVIFPSPFNVQTTLGAGTTVAQGVWIEALCTSELVFTIIMLAKEKHRATFVAPVGIGLALFIAELVAVYYTGGSLNPARSFGPAAVAHDFTSHHWIYWVGPFVGSVLAVGFYQLMKILEYEMANPGQDGDVENDPTQNPDHEVAQTVEERQAEVEELQAIEEEQSSAVPTDSLDNVTVAGFKDNGDLDLRRKELTRKQVRGENERLVQNIGRNEARQDLEAQWPGSTALSSSDTSGDAYIKEKRKMRQMNETGVAV